MRDSFGNKPQTQENHFEINHNSSLNQRTVLIKNLKELTEVAEVLVTSIC